jgi:hypothetical protein
VWTPPLRELTPETSAGFECIDFATSVLGLNLFPWQKWTLIHALELLPDGTFRFRTVVLLVARQNGKSTLMQVLTLWRMYMDGAPLVIGTAQDLDTAEEQWQFVVDMAEEIPELAAEVAQVLKVNGKKQLRLVTGERYKVRAASRRAGRGLTGDLVLLDELREHQTWEAWGAVTKTTMARVRSQVWAASNAGDLMSVVLGFLRGLAHLALGDPDGINEGASAPGDLSDDEELDGDSLGIFEYSAAPGCEKWDRVGWAHANPSLGHPDGVSEKALASAARTDPEAVFRTECLCQWVARLVESAIPIVQWAARCRPESAVTGQPVFVLDVSPKLTYSAVGFAGLNASGDTHVELLCRDGQDELDYRPGTDWVLPALVDLASRVRGLRVTIGAGSQAETLAPEITKAGIGIDRIPAKDIPAACGLLYKLATSGGLAHIGQPELSAAVGSAKWRDTGEGAQVWGRSKSYGEITPLYMATFGAWAVGLANDYNVLDSFY